LVTSSRLIKFMAVIVFLAATLFGNIVQAQSQPQARIVTPIKNEERVTVNGTTSPLLKTSVDMGRMVGGQNLGRMVLMLTPTEEQEQAAAQLIAVQHDSSSPSFHKWLTPAQFGQQFGVAPDDATKVQQWLQGQGLTVHEVAQSRRFVVFSGTVGQVEQAFSTEMHSYNYKNKNFIANSRDIQIPAALSSVVKGVVRLHSDPRNPALKIGEKYKVNKKTGKIEMPYGQHILGPADFAQIYNLKPLYAAGIDGTGQSIAIVSRSSLVDPNYGIDGLQDIHDFRNVMGLPVNDPVMIINGDDPGVLSFNDTVEAMLDVTWAGAVAPMATIKVVASQSNFSDGVDVSAAYIVDHNLAPVLSASFGSCEQSLGSVYNAFYNALWQQAAAQGITAFVSAGDNGGAGCDSQSSGDFASQGVAVNGLASTPYNVAVGGTQFEDTDNPDTYWNVTSDPTTLQSVISYIPEKVWNESSNDPFFTSLWAGSGGVSTIYAKPDWQTATGVPNDGKRDLPDISLAAAGHTGYAICFEASCNTPDQFIALYSVGGTSASSPAAAGIMALINQKMNGQPQGIANYIFYRLAATPGIYHDITVGDNKVPDLNGQFTVGYSAAPGYDLASGLGSFDVTALVNHWASAANTAGSATTLALGSGQATTVIHGSPIAFQAKVTCGGAPGCTAPKGEVALLATSASGDAVGVGGGPLSPSSSGSVANITSETVPGGTYGVSARYSGDGKYYASTSNTLNLTVTPEASQMMMGGISASGLQYITAPLSIGYGEPVPLWIAVAGKSGYGHPSGKISLLVDGNPTDVYASDYQTLSSMTLNYGEKSIVFGNGTTLTDQSSVLPNLHSGLPAGTHQLDAAYPGDNSFTGSQASYSINVTKTDSVIADVFLLGTAVPNVPVDVAGQIVLANNGCAPYGGTVTLTDYTSGTPVVLASGPADQQNCDSFKLRVTFPTAGQHLTRVNFTGDSNVNASVATGNLTVSDQSNTYSYFTTFAADNPNVVVGSTVTLTAQVGSDVRQYIPTGNVVFLDGATTLGTVKLDATGTATLAVTNFAAGTHNLSANYAGDAVLLGSTGGPIAEMIADYTIQAQPTSLTIAAGQSGTATLNIIPLGGSTQTVQLSCGTLPADISCSFTPTSVTLDGVTQASVKVTVNTKLTTANASIKTHILGAASTLAFAGLLLPFVRRKRLNTLLGMAALLVVALVGVGCGSSGNSNVAHQGVYVLNVTATGGTGSAAKTVPLVVTVTP
jgi:hypothetical protein